MGLLLALIVLAVIFGVVGLVVASLKFLLFVGIVLLIIAVARAVISRGTSSRI
ncbi:MAG: hypothetical protein QOG52_952 [Frankiaceae bacterium]|jgi:hypothetical protein|nr:hypothetical protein [Frankiaceae bacterium]MDQ1715674.1 hypothetical protein [Frankiaceae bacterium]MDQ1723924.1 hypothetical protein [Frankiaceae bacterium]